MKRPNLDPHGCLSVVKGQDAGSLPESQLELHIRLAGGHHHHSAVMDADDGNPMINSLELNQRLGNQLQRDPSG